MFGPVRLHELFHFFHQLPFILRKLHINEINNDNTSKITQT